MPVLIQTVTTAEPIGSKLSIASSMTTQEGLWTVKIENLWKNVDNY